jgi:YHS domain-containing protein
VKAFVAAAIAATLGVGTAAAVEFETCIPAAGETPAFTVEHAGKTYGLRTEECRVEFLSDPERYAQLYEALQELARTEGRPPETAGSVSLVPS